jgi:hypothetical protein
MKRNGSAAKISQILLAAAVVIICFAAGVLSVLATRDQGDSQPTLDGPGTAVSRRDSFRSPAEEDQILLLILGTDRLSSPDPELRAIWYVTYRPPGGTVFLYGLPLSWGSRETPSREAREHFSWSRMEGISQAFLDALPLAPDAVLVLDSEAFASLIDFAGGVDLDDSQLAGSQVVELLEGLIHQPGAQLRLQARILSALAAKSGDLGGTPDLTPLLAQIPEHAYTSVPAVDLISNLSPLLPLKQGDIHMQLLLPD